MSKVIGWRDGLAIILVSVLCSVIFLFAPFNRVHGWSIDALTALRWELLGARRDPASVPVAVVVIDEETYETPPFKGSPTQTWTTELGRVLDSVIEGGARVVGFDIIFPTSIEQSAIPFGEDVLGSRLHGFDRPFLRSLARGAAAGKVVLGEVARGERSIRPAPGQQIAVGHEANIRALNVYADSDDVVRRMPLTFLTDGERVPAMALELASRALDARPAVAPDGRVTLAGYFVPSAVPNTFTLNFEGGANDVQAFSFADLHACAMRADTDFFRRKFADKVVIFGTLLDSEDRKFTSKRFATGLDGAQAERCVLPAPPTTAHKFRRSSIAGVFIHATAVHNLLARDAVTELGRVPLMMIAIGFAALASLAAQILTPGFAAVTYGIMAALWTSLGIFAFTQSLALPLSEPFFSGLASVAATTAYRLVVSDRKGRFLRKSFALYLAPQVIERMLASNRLPVLGGETREVTVLFSDLAGFSAISERLSPGELVALMNEYLSEMTEIIERNGGYIDKYIGDSIVAVFGAPADDSEHATNAARAALACCQRLEQLNRESAAFRGHTVAHRIGINSGEALVGNIGSRRRFSYSVMSDAVNVASRLEGANKFYGTSIIASESTVNLTGSRFRWRELDTVRVQGRVNPLRIYQLVANAGEETPEQAAACGSYAQGLAHWRAGEFEAAARCFGDFAEPDQPSALFFSRATATLKDPPHGPWEAVNLLAAK